ncbi:hypothetical protein SALBM135S_08603 [Streptomyces alboniger]
MARSSVLQNVTFLPVVVVPFVASVPVFVSSAESDLVLPASEPSEPEPPCGFASPPEDEDEDDDEDEEPLEDECFPEPSPPQAVSERVAARLTAARAVTRVYFTVFPQE